MVTVLDWGLGHATRSVPLVEELLSQGAFVVLGGSGSSGQLLRLQFPNLPYIEFPAYRIHYRGPNIYFAILQQLPKMIRVIYREHQLLKRLAIQYLLDGVISDSRFGCFHARLPSVFVAHQLRILLPSRWMYLPVNFLYRLIVRRFGAVWVPDTVAAGGLSGHLSHPSPFRNTQYLGLLSRLHPTPTEQHYDLLVLLSGPEPQRSRLENLIRKQVAGMNLGRVLLVQGKAEAAGSANTIDGPIEIIPYLDATDLSQALSSSGVILCRSGYSSLMDLVRLRRRTILVPTPDQPEQEYLAQRCADAGWAVAMSQRHFNLAKAMAQVEQAIGFPAYLEGGTLVRSVKIWLDQL